jgi:hypothetical protein
MDQNTKICQAKASAKPLLKDATIPPARQPVADGYAKQALECNSSRTLFGQFIIKQQQQQQKQKKGRLWCED